MENHSDSFAYIQEQFTEEYNKVQADERRIARESLWRRVIAYGFKLLAVIGGIAVAAGVNEQASQIIGVGIAVAVALDGIFSNHERLLVAVNARDAYRRLINQVRRKHQQQLAFILKLKEKDELAAKSTLTELCQLLLSKLHNDCEQIEEALRTADLKALRGISMEQHRKLE